MKERKKERREKEKKRKKDKKMGWNVEDSLRTTWPQDESVDFFLPWKLAQTAPQEGVSTLRPFRKRNFDR